MTIRYGNTWLKEVCHGKNHSRSSKVIVAGSSERKTIQCSDVMLRAYSQDVSALRTVERLTLSPDSCLTNWLRMQDHGEGNPNESRGKTEKPRKATRCETRKQKI